MPNIGTISIKINADAASFISGIQSATTKAASFGVAIGTLAANALQGAATKMLEFGQRTLKLGDELQKASVRTGVTVESLGALKHAASLADVDFETLQGSLARMAKNAAGLTTAAKEQQSVFGRLGAEVRGTGGGFRAMDAILVDVAERINNLKDPLAKVAVAQEVFGRGGARMLPLLKDLAHGGFAEARAEAEKLGLILSGETARASEKFNDNMQRLQGAVQGVANRILTPLLPAMAGFSAAAVSGAKDSSGLVSVAELMAGAFQLIGAGVLVSVTAFRQLGMSIGQAGTEFLLFWRGLKAGNFDELIAGQKIFDAKSKALWVGYITDMRLIMGEELPKALEPLKKTFQELAAAADAAAAKAAAKAAEIAKKVKETAQTIADLIEKQRGEMKELINPAPVLVAGWSDLSKEAAEFSKSLAASAKWLQLIEQFKPKPIFLSEDADFMKDLGARGKLQFEALESGMKRVRDQAKEFQTDMRELGGRIGQEISNAIINFKSLGDVLKSIGQEIVALIVKMTIIRPLEKFFTDTFSGGFLSGLKSLFGGRQHGGPVSASTPYVVGEAGAEIFVPRTSGVIVPAGVTGALGSSVVVNYNIDARNAGPGVEHKIVRAMQVTHAQSVGDALRLQQEMAMRHA